LIDWFDGVRIRLWTAATNGHNVYPPDDASWRATVEWYWRGKNWRTRRKNCPSATLSTTNPTWTDPGLRSERPVTYHLSHGAASNNVLLSEMRARVHNALHINRDTRLLFLANDWVVSAVKPAAIIRRIRRLSKTLYIHTYIHVYSCADKL
jgi:hypothetical protein